MSELWTPENEPDFESELELERLVLQCSKDECEGAVWITPATAQLFLDPAEPKYDHVHSMCSEPACEQRTIRFLDTMKSLDTIYDFREGVDVTYFDHRVGTYSKAIRGVYERGQPKPVEVELKELTPRQEKLVGFFAYLMREEYTMYKEF